MTFDDALLRLAGRCAAMEMCEYDCRKKLAAWRVPPQDADRIIADLYSKGFLSAQRYARAFVADKARFNLWGRMRLRRELAMRRLPAPVISEALEALPETDYLGFAEAAARMAMRGVDITGRQGRDAFARRMVSRGYEWSVIRRLLSAGGGDAEGLPDDDGHEETL